MTDERPELTKRERLLVDGVKALQAIQHAGALNDQHDRESINIGVGVLLHDLRSTLRERDAEPEEYLYD